MRKGFIGGILAGSMIGAIAAMFYAPQFKKESQKLMTDTRQMKNRARRVIKGVKNATDDWMK